MVFQPQDEIDRSNLNSQLTAHHGLSIRKTGHLSTFTPMVVMAILGPIIIGTTGGCKENSGHREEERSQSSGEDTSSARIPFADIDTFALAATVRPGDSRQHAAAARISPGDQHRIDAAMAATMADPLSTRMIAETIHDIPGVEEYLIAILETTKLEIQKPETAKKLLSGDESSEAAIRLLGAMEYRGAVPLMMRLLLRCKTTNRTPSSFQRALINALVDLGDTGALPVMGAVAMRSERHPKVRLLRAMVPLASRLQKKANRTKTEERLLEDTILLMRLSTGDEFPMVREAAVEGLGAIGGAASLGTIARLLSMDPDPMVRNAAASQLAPLGGTSEVEYLATALYDDFPPVVAAAAQGLARIGGPTARSGVLHYLATGRQEAVAPIVEAAASLRISRAAPFIIALLTSKDGYVVATAANALADMRITAAIPVLRSALANENPNARRAAVRALGTLHAMEARGDLLRLEGQDPDESVRQEARLSLDRLKSFRTPP